MGETIRMRASDAQSEAYRTGLVAALDVGTSKTICLVARAEPASLRVIGAALHETKGLRSGTVTKFSNMRRNPSRTQSRRPKIWPISKFEACSSRSIAAARKASPRAWRRRSAARLSPIRICWICWPRAAPTADSMGMKSSSARPPPMWWMKLAAFAIRVACSASVSARRCMASPSSHRLCKI